MGPYKIINNVTGEVAERINRRWMGFELIEDYLKGSKYRFNEFSFENWEENNGQKSFFIREKNRFYQSPDKKKLVKR